LDEIRVLLINMRGILGDVVKSVLLNCADVSVVADCADAADARVLVASTGAKVVVVCPLGDAAAAALATSLFEPYRRVKVIAVREDGRQAILWELHPRQSVLGDLSPRLLLDTVRQVSRP